MNVEGANSTPGWGVAILSDGQIIQGSYSVIAFSASSVSAVISPGHTYYAYSQNGGSLALIQWLEQR